MTISAASLRESALAAERAGQVEQAARLFADAVAKYPGDAALINSAGSYHARRREYHTALGYFEAAVRAMPEYGEAVVNRAITLAALDRPSDALSILKVGERQAKSDPRYWSARGGIERTCNDRAAAAFSYENCLRLAPQHPRALHGRARIALERGEADAVARFKQALSVTPGDAELWLGHSQALEMEGDAAGARTIAQALVDQAPGWIAALELLAQQRWSSGDGQAFCDHYAEAARRQPENPEIMRSWCRMLAGVDRFVEAADVAATARNRFPGHRDFSLLEAAYAGEGGDDLRAERIFGVLTLDTDERHLHEARHLLRLRKPRQAEALLERVTINQPDAIGAWALRDIAWRLLGDQRHHWLHGQPGLIGTQPLGIDRAEHSELVAFLDQLHDYAGWPIGQSVRNGTQTRGGLFDRCEPIIERFAKSVAEAVIRHQESLPAADLHHPLLRHRDTRWRIVGSWSIRLTGSGRHTEHIHPLGILSSAAHLIVPDRTDDAVNNGALELGRPPPDLRVDLPPIAFIQPSEGYCALFPSTLYHGTRHFSAGKRLSVAFDVARG